MSIDKLKTKFFTGAWLTDVKHYFTKINEIIDYLNGNGSSGDGSYKELISSFTQSGTSAPVNVTLKNTTGITIGSWTRTYDGFYKLTVNGATSINTITKFSNWNGNAGTYQVISDQSSVLGYITYYIGQPNELWLEVYDDTFTQVDYSTLFGTTSYPIEIKIFN